MNVVIIRNNKIKSEQNKTKVNKALSRRKGPRQDALGIILAIAICSNKVGTFTRYQQIPAKLEMEANYIKT